MWYRTCEALLPLSRALTLAQVPHHASKQRAFLPRRRVYLQTSTSFIHGTLSLVLDRCDTVRTRCLAHADRPPVPAANYQRHRHARHCRCARWVVHLMRLHIRPSETIPAQRKQPLSLATYFAATAACSTHTLPPSAYPNHRLVARGNYLNITNGYHLRFRDAFSAGREQYSVKA